jgi:hypothetical protein
MKRNAVGMLGAGILVAVISAMAEGPSSEGISFTATADNVAATNSIKIDVLRWSTDAELTQMMDAWNKTGAIAKKAIAEAARAATQAAAAQRRVDRGTTGTARREQVDDATRAANAAAAAAAQKKAQQEAQQKITPEDLLVAAMKETPAVGYVWSSGEISGYMVRYAVKLPDPNGGERIILVTDKRLGRWNNFWKPAAADPSNYEFSVIELHLDAKGDGEGKASLTGKVHLDNTGKILVLDDYNSSPVVLRGVKKLG